MIAETALKIGSEYNYFSASKAKTERVTFKGKRNDIYVFSQVTYLNEIWVTDLSNISNVK